MQNGLRLLINFVILPKQACDFSGMPGLAIKLPGALLLSSCRNT
jgi:hypothetical protein